MFHTLDVKLLEQFLNEAVIKGQPRTHKPWKKIIIIVEGTYRYNVCSFFVDNSLCF